MNRYTKLTLLREIGMWIFAIIMLLPFYLLINTALKNTSDAISTAGYTPVKNPSLESFKEVTQGDGARTLFEGLFNSLFITTLAVCGIIAISSITAYVLARRLTRLSNVTFYALLVGIVVPSQLGLVPIYIGAKSLGLIGKTWGLSFLYVAFFLPLAIFLYSGFIRNLPTEYEQAAFIDLKVNQNASNAQCNDCKANKSTHVSLTFGTFYCSEYALLHRQEFEVVKGLDEVFDLYQLKVIEMGGNLAFRQFLDKYEKEKEKTFP
jgi:hypothetical protein